LPLHFGKVADRFHGGGSQPFEDIPKYLRMMKDGRFDPRPFVSHPHRARQVNDGIARMRSGEVVHCMIHFPANP